MQDTGHPHPTDRTAEAPPVRNRGSPGEVLAAFLKLGLTSFGGPIAHIGYFRTELVMRRRWVDEAAYADLVALCQFLPGPASSQVGFALGLIRAGLLGGLAAWTGFTLPSALLMAGFAYGAAWLAGPGGLAATHGLRLVAVAVVAQAVLGMARILCPDPPRAAIALAAIALVTLAGSAAGQLGAIAAGALLGWRLCRGDPAGPAPPAPAALSRPMLSGPLLSRGAGAAFLALFLGLLIALPTLHARIGWQGFAMIDAFYRAGALVFGGGHVVLPLLQEAVVAPGWIGEDAFLFGYGAAQAMPGPLFTFAAYLGAALGPPPHGAVGAAIALVSVFFPGILILLAALPFWHTLRARPAAQAALRGANAAVVGILAAALYDPVWVSAVQGQPDFLLVAAGFVALVAWRAPPWLVVLGVTLGAVAFHWG